MVLFTQAATRVLGGLRSNNDSHVVNISMHTGQEELRHRHNNGDSNRSNINHGSSDKPLVRRLKHMAGAVDAIGIRFGVFLRRFPLARVGIILYMGLLHAWVMLVIFSTT